MNRTFEDELHEAHGMLWRLKQLIYKHDRSKRLNPSVIYSASDITLGKPRMKEFPHTASVHHALTTLKSTNQVEVAVWQMPRRYTMGQGGEHNPKGRVDRFLGIISLMDIMVFLASPESLQNPGRALQCPVADIVRVSRGLIQYVDPATRLYDALELFLHGAERLLVPLNSKDQRLSSHFSVVYNGRWIVSPPATRSSSLLMDEQEYCCLALPEIIRFLTGCLGALAPIPLTSVDSLGIVKRDFLMLNAEAQALAAADIFQKARSRGNHAAIAVVEETVHRDTQDCVAGSNDHQIVGEVSTYSLPGCDDWVVAAFATLSAAEFTMYCSYYGGVCSLPQLSSKVARDSGEDLANGDHVSVDKPSTMTSVALGRLEKVTCLCNSPLLREPLLDRLGEPLLDRLGYSSRRPMMSKLVTCRPRSSLAAVLAQMLSHGATHVWVTEEDGRLLGIITPLEIVKALCGKHAVPKYEE